MNLKKLTKMIVLVPTALVVFGRRLRLPTEAPPTASALTDVNPAKHSKADRQNPPAKTKREIQKELMGRSPGAVQRGARAQLGKFLVAHSLKTDMPESFYNRTPAEPAQPSLAVAALQVDPALSAAEATPSSMTEHEADPALSAAEEKPTNLDSIKNAAGWVAATSGLEGEAFSQKTFSLLQPAQIIQGTPSGSHAGHDSPLLQSAQIIQGTPSGQCCKEKCCQLPEGSSHYCAANCEGKGGEEVEHAKCNPLETDPQPELTCDVIGFEDAKSEEDCTRAFEQLTPLYNSQKINGRSAQRLKDAYDSCKALALVAYCQERVNSFLAEFEKLNFIVGDKAANARSDAEQLRVNCKVLFQADGAMMRRLQAFEARL